VIPRRSRTGPSSRARPQWVRRKVYYRRRHMAATQGPRAGRERDLHQTGGRPSRRRNRRRQGIGRRGGVVATMVTPKALEPRHDTGRPSRNALVAAVPTRPIRKRGSDERTAGPILMHWRAGPARSGRPGTPARSAARPSAKGAVRRGDPQGRLPPHFPARSISGEAGDCRAPDQALVEPLTPPS